MTGMPEFWNQFEGSTTAGYVLGRRLDSAGQSAEFEARGGDETLLARLTAGESAAAQAHSWGRIAELSHPNLLRVLDTGLVDCEGGPVAYALLERPDEVLGAVLESRALTEDEAGQALLATAEALAFLHRSGFVHGELSAWKVVATGETVKLRGDGARAAGGGASAAADVRALGLTACRMLALEPGEAPASGRFAPLIVNCLREDGAGWTAAEAAAWLRDPREEAAPAAAPEPLVEAAVVRSSTARAPTSRRWVYAATAGCALAGVLYVAAKARRDPPAPAPVPRPAAARPEPARTPARPSALAARVAPAPVAPAPVAPAPVAKDGRIWRVIAYTYNGSGPAEKRVRSLNERWPQFEAEVFAPWADGGPYLVSLNGRMTREEALRVQRAALARGLPRDTFVQNYRDVAPSQADRGVVPEGPPVR